MKKYFISVEYSTGECKEFESVDLKESSRLIEEAAQRMRTLKDVVGIFLEEEVNND